MIDERTRELINAALDGELSAAERTELDRLLAASEAARRYQAELRALDETLGRLPDLEVPDDLHAGILRRVGTPEARVARIRPGVSDWPGFVRFGFAAAAGVLVAVGLYQFGPDPDNPADLDRMTGTMARGAMSAMDEFSFESGDLSSSVVLGRRDGSLVLDVSIESGGPVELNIDLAGTSLQTFGSIRETGDFETLEHSARAVRLRSRGKQNFAVLLKHDKAASDQDGAIRLEYSSDGKLVQQGALVPSGEERQ